MMLPFEFTIPGDPTELSPNRRLHPYVRRRLKNEWQGRAWLCWAEAGRVRFEQPVTITLCFRRGRLVDPDNALASCKALIDGLTDQPGRPGMIVNDDAVHVAFLPVRFETGKQWATRPEVIVRVEDRG